MANLQNSPLLSAKLRTKDAANRIKHGSPKFQEVFRQRCRRRMKEKRNELFNKRRHGLMETDEDVHETLTEIVRSELSQLATMDIDGGNPLVSLDFGKPLTEDEALALESEIIAEEEQWILLEYERLQRDEAEMLALFAEETLKESVICPLCERGTVIENINFLACSTCDLRLPLKSSVENFAKTLEEKIASHSSVCYGQPCFMVMPENETICLYLTCETCPTFALII